MGAYDIIVAEHEARTYPTGTARTVRIPGLPGKVDALVGMRRVGKTWRLFQHLCARLAEGTPKAQVLYANLEDERIDFARAPLAGLLDAWNARYPDVVDRPRWLYLDEVQNAPDWERFVRRVLDQRGIEVLVTGSSSKLLSTEVATSLRGRALSTEILPFSFEEALRHAGSKVPEKWPLASRERARIEKAWRGYVETGGFPEVQGIDEDLRRRVLRDIIERNEVKRVAALRWIVRRLLANPAGRFTANRLHRDLKSQGIAVGKDTVHEMVSFIEDAHLVYPVSLWTPSVQRRSTNPRKAYPVDFGLSRTVAFARAEDDGHCLETLVYLELRRRGHREIGYYETRRGFEVDFCYRSGDAGLRLVQVSVHLDDPVTRERELRALEEAMEELDIEEATLVTTNAEDEETVGSGVVHVVPAWRWMLEPR